MNADDKLSAILRMEADTVEPSPAGWDAIQAGIAARRRRVWWVRGSSLAGAVAVVAAVAVFVTADRGPRSIEQPPATTSPSTSPTVSPSATPTTAGPPDADPTNAIWPLTTWREVRAWQKDHATYPALAAPRDAALAFAHGYLGVADAEVSPLSAGDYAVSRRDPNGAAYEVTRVTVQGFGEGGTAPFVPVLAVSPSLTLQRPALGVTSPLRVRGTYQAVDPAIQVRLRADGPGSAPVDLASGRATTSPPNAFSASLSFTTTAVTGSVLVTNGSAIDSGIAAASAVPVTFGAGAQREPVPGSFVSVKDERVALLSTATGALVRYLTPAEPTGGAGGPELAPDGRTVLYTQSMGTCTTEIRRVPVAGGAPAVVVPFAEGTALTHPSANGDALAYARTRCLGGPAANDPVEVVARYATGTPVVTRVDGELRSGPVAGPRFVAFVTAKGGVTTLHLVDSLGELEDARTPAPIGCDWLAATWGAPDASDRPTVVAATTCGSKDETGDTRLYRVDEDGRAASLLAHIGSLNVTSLDYSAGFAHLLIGQRDSGGPDAWQAYTWEGGRLTRVPGQPFVSPTWH